MNSLSGEGSQPGDPGERIDSYLDQLLLALRGSPREARRLLAEVESHLRESVDAQVAAGLSEPEATGEALRRLGPPSAVAGGLPSRAAFGDLIGSGDVVATGATMMAAALLCWAVLARQATRPARALTA